MTTAPAPARRRRIIMLLLGGAVIIGVALLASLLQPDRGRPGAAPVPTASAPSPDGGASEPPQDESAPTMPDVARRIPDDMTALGSVEAPVVLVEYADYRCPYCGVFARDTLPQLVSEYVDAGALRVEWRDTPIFGEDSENAAIAARAAGRQGRFWQYNHAVYAHQGSSRKDLPRETLIGLAEQVGVPDVAAFTADLDDPQLRADVQTDAAEAQSLGVPSTPVFLIGSTPVMGAQPVDAFREVIDAELARGKD